MSSELTTNNNINDCECNMYAELYLFLQCLLLWPQPRPRRIRAPSKNEQDHVGAAGLVANDFADDQPMAVSSNRIRKIFKRKDKRDPDSGFGNNRGVPVPEK